MGRIFCPIILSPLLRQGMFGEDSSSSSPFSSSMIHLIFVLLQNCQLIQISHSVKKADEVISIDIIYMIILLAMMFVGVVTSLKR